MNPVIVLAGLLLLWSWWKGAPPMAGSRSIADLDPATIPLAEAWLDAALVHLAGSGYSVDLTSTRRTEAEQVALYAIGRTVQTDRNPVTYRDGVSKRSTHQDGRSWDFVIRWIDGGSVAVWYGTSDHVDALYLELGEIGERMGLTWGGRWWPRDVYHLEDRTVLV